MRPSSAARRYAEAAFEVAAQTRAVAEWLRQLGDVRDGLESSTAALFFKDPNVTRDQKLETLAVLFPDVGPEVMNLLKMLAVRDRLHLLPAICRDMEALDRQARGVLEAEVTVARPFGQDEKNDIARRLADATGKHVDVQMNVDPSLLGGIVVRIGDELIDASVAGRLARLRHQMAI